MELQENIIKNRLPPGSPTVRMTGRERRKKTQFTLTVMCDIVLTELDWIGLELRGWKTQNSIRNLYHFPGILRQQLSQRLSEQKWGKLGSWGIIHYKKYRYQSTFCLPVVSHLFCYIPRKLTMDCPKCQICVEKFTMETGDRVPKVLSLLLCQIHRTKTNLRLLSHYMLRVCLKIDCW